MTDAHRELPGLLTPEATLHRLADQLATRFAGVFTRETIDRHVFESYTALARTAKVTATCRC
jgi:arsenate reductase (thioredoxin)